jgi:DNA-binding CsgD family transcriptional regulator
MAHLDWLRRAFAQAKRPASESDPPVSHGEAAPFGGKPGIAEAQKRERILKLTPREKELCLLLLQGYTLKESAGMLGIKYSTVNTHMNGVYRKLGVNSRAELIIIYRTSAGEGPGNNTGNGQ